MSETTPVAEPWLAYLHLELKDCIEDCYESDIINILITYLSTEEDDAAQAALQVDSVYQKRFIEAKFWATFTSDKGMATFLNFLYLLVFPLSKKLPYDSFKHKKLAQLLLELRKLPPKEYEMDGEIYHDYTHNPVFFKIWEDFWNAFVATESQERRLSPEEFEERCSDWINFSAFLARCLNGGLDYDEDGGKCASVEIPRGLEPRRPLSPAIRDCFVSVAVQYLTLAPEMLFKIFVKNKETGSKSYQYGVDRWKIWAGKLEELETLYENEGEKGAKLLGLVKQARKNLLVIGKELFATGGTSVEVVEQKANEANRREDE